MKLTQEQQAKNKIYLEYIFWLKKVIKQFQEEEISLNLINEQDFH